jgi:hypothetical protein
VLLVPDERVINEKCEIVAPTKCESGPQRSVRVVTTEKCENGAPTGEGV